MRWPVPSWNVASGRFAPSPTGDLHLGNLRTAVLAWLFARSAGSAFVVRMEDLDRAQASTRHEARQLADLADMGLDWDGPVVRQSDRFDRYRAAIDQLTTAGRTYPCWCTRREVREAASAPHHTSSAGNLGGDCYPGTCRDLSSAARRDRERSGRPSALRLRALGEVVTVHDELRGDLTAAVDDLVLQRNDGVPAYHLAVVVDDDAQGVEEVVRADDLAPVTPSQRHLGRLLGLAPVRYVHVPMVLGPDGRRLAKRDGAVTLSDQRALGRSPADVRSTLLASAGLDVHGEADTSMVDLARRFHPAGLARHPVRWVDGALQPVAANQE